MGRYRVKPGQEIGHNGTTYHEGDIIDIDDHIAAEGNVRSRVDPCDATGAVVKAPNPIEAELARSRPHERISILEAELARRRQGVKDIEDALAAEMEQATKPADLEVDEDQ